MPNHMSRRSQRGQANEQDSLLRASARRRRRILHGSVTPADDAYAQRVHDVRHLLSGEWVWDILVALHRRPLQYTKLLHAIRAKPGHNGWPGRKHLYLQDSTLNRTLRRMEQGELVRHSREPQFPYHATYELSSAAEELLTAMVPVIEWAESHSDLVERVRKRRRGDGATNG